MERRRNALAAMAEEFIDPAAPPSMDEWDDVPDEHSLAAPKPTQLEDGELQAWLAAGGQPLSMRGRKLSPAQVASLVDAVTALGQEANLQGCWLDCGGARAALLDKCDGRIVGDRFESGGQFFDGLLALDRDCRILMPPADPVAIAAAMPWEGQPLSFDGLHFGREAVVALAGRPGVASTTSPPLHFRGCTFDSVSDPLVTYDEDGDLYRDDDAPVALAGNLQFENCLFNGAAWLCPPDAAEEPAVNRSVSFRGCLFTGPADGPWSGLCVSGPWARIDVEATSCGHVAVQAVPAATSVRIDLTGAASLSIDDVALSGGLVISTDSGANLSLSGVSVAAVRLGGTFGTISATGLSVGSTLVLDRVQARSVSLADLKCRDLRQEGELRVPGGLDLSGAVILDTARLGPLVAGEATVAKAQVGKLVLAMPLAVGGTLDFSGLRSPASELHLFDVTAGTISFDGATLGALRLGRFRKASRRVGGDPEEVAREARLPSFLRKKGTYEAFLAVDAVRCSGSIVLTGLCTGVLEIGGQPPDGLLPDESAPSAVEAGGDLDLRGATVGSGRGRGSRISIAATSVRKKIDARDSVFKEICFLGNGSLAHPTCHVSAGAVELDHMRVARDVDLVGLRAGTLSMRDARIEDGAMLLYRPGVGGPAAAAQLSGEANLAGLRAGRLAVNKDCLSATAKVALDLTGARIEWLQYDGSDSLPRPLCLQGADVRLLDASADDRCCLSRPEYTPSLDGALLSRLSRELEEEGRPDLSDQVMRTLRKRQLAEERERCWEHGRPARALWLALVDLLWRGLLDYGARPLRPLAFSAALCLGLLAVFLEPLNVVPSTAALTVRQDAYATPQAGPRKDDHPSGWTAWNAAWMAAGKAFPAIDLHVEEDWQPSSAPGVIVFGRRMVGSAEHWTAAIGLLNLLLVPVALLALGRKALIRFKD